VEVWAAQPLSQASTYFDDLIFPPGYYEYLLYGTCARIYPRFARPIDPAIAALYQEAKLNIESANWYDTPTEALVKVPKAAQQKFPAPPSPPPDTPGAPPR
jgi:hypothetical protein